MSAIKFVQAGDKLTYEAYGKTIALKHPNKWRIFFRLLTPSLISELKERIKNDQ